MLSNICKEYIAYFLQSKTARNYYFDKVTGITIKNLSLEAIRNCEIPLPPLAEQHRIVSAVESTFAVIDEIEQNKTDLQSAVSATKQKILSLAVSGKLVRQDPNDEPASVLLERIRSEREKLISEGKIKRVKGDFSIIRGCDNPYYQNLHDGWAVCNIGSIAFVTKLAGFEYTSDIFPNLSNSGVPLFKGQNVQDGDIIYEFESFIPEKISDDLKRSQITHKCILTPYVGTIGNGGIHNRSGKFHLGSNVGKIELYGGVLEEYVLAFIRSAEGYQELTKTRKATAQESISIQAIREVVLPLPPLAEQHRIVAMIETAFEQLGQITKNIN